MALNIKDPATESLAAELAALTGTTKTGAVRSALREALVRLDADADVTGRAVRLERFLCDEAWPQVPVELRGHHPLSKQEREALLGYGPDGV